MTRPVLLNKTRPKLSFSSFLSPRWWWWWYPFAPVFSSPPALKKESPPPFSFLMYKVINPKQGKREGGGLTFRCVIECVCPVARLPPPMDDVASKWPLHFFFFSSFSRLFCR